MYPEPIEVTLLVTQVLEQLSIPYLIGGSFASTIYGMVRTTQDVDIIAEMGPNHIRYFTDALRGAFFIDEEMIAVAIGNKSSFNIVHRNSMFKVDVFIPKNAPFQESQFARARRHILSAEPDIRANFASPEDTILAKLQWYRLGGEISEKQWGDILGIMRVMGEALDYEYLHKWANELRVKDLLKKAIHQNA